MPSTNWGNSAAASSDWAGGVFVSRLGVTMNSTSYTMNDSVATVNDETRNTATTDYTATAILSTNWTLEDADGSAGAILLQTSSSLLFQTSDIGALQ